MIRPTLYQIPFPDPFPPTQEIIVTFGANQWDPFLEECYNKHCILLEVDDQEKFVAAYQKPKEEVVELPTDTALS